MFFKCFFYNFNVKKIKKIILIKKYYTLYTVNNNNKKKTTLGDLVISFDNATLTAEFLGSALFLSWHGVCLRGKS
jgi:hypothetical protein